MGINIVILLGEIPADSKACSIQLSANSLRVWRCNMVSIRSYQNQQAQRIF